MTLSQILIFAGAGLAVGTVARGRVRLYTLLGMSVLAIYWLQPGMPVRNLDFWLPTATLAISGVVWAGTRVDGTAALRREDLWTALLVTGLVLGMGLTRLIEPLCCITATRPPAVGQIAAAVGVAGALAAGVRGLRAGRSSLAGALTAGVVVLFVILKTPALTHQLSAGLRGIMAQDAGLASALDVRWLGFSYVAFRWIHVLRDRMSGRLPEVGLGEFLTFVLFYPAYVAGPIDKVQRFAPEVAGDFKAGGEDLRVAGERLTLGIFKKFVIADSLALAALNGQNAGQITETGWMWVALYAYTLQLYFDFSGYTDTAIGLGRLVGVRLPENFNRPYLQNNLTGFWNAWHMSLAQWFRGYWFNPVTRALRTGAWKPPTWAVILIGQLTTMGLLGLWHGVTWNFLIWGLWHGMGLFVHNRWSDLLKQKSWFANLPPSRQRVLDWLGWALTLQFVALGWVWFSLPEPALAGRVFAVLLGGE